MFKPYSITTDQFAEQWQKISLDKKATYTTPMIATPQLFTQVVNNKLNLTPI
ncbi:MAG: hypothetical protein ACMG6E_07030 [Candidatus Roizmanbacteria bacterium]